jgi:hypothetical protein
MEDSALKKPRQNSAKKSKTVTIAKDPTAAIPIKRKISAPHNPTQTVYG